MQREVVEYLHTHKVYKYKHLFIYSIFIHAYVYAYANPHTYIRTCACPHVKADVHRTLYRKANKNFVLKKLVAYILYVSFRKRAANYEA